MVDLTVADVAELVQGDADGDTQRTVRGVATLESAGPDELSFVAQARYLPYVHTTRAAAVLTPRKLAAKLPDALTHIRVDDAHVALYRLLPVLYPAAPPEPGIHPTAVVDATAEIGEGVAIGPYVVIGAGAAIGPRSTLDAHVVIGANARIGAECTLHPHSTIYPEAVLGDRCRVQSGARIGREGFGYVWIEGGHRPVPQIGRCIIGDDVDVGTNVTIDRGSVGDTMVGDGTKVDSLVHVAHNVRVGRHSLLVAQVGIAGSTHLGEGVVLGGQVGIAGHLNVGAGARAGAQAGIIGDVAAGETVSGYPARPHREALRAQASLFRLPEWFRRIQRLERAVFGSGGGTDDRGESA